MTLLVVHKAWQPFDGEFIRVRNVATEVIRALQCERVTELVVIPALPPTRFVQAWRGAHAIHGSRRIILPLVFPRLHMPFMRSLNRVLQIGAGWAAGRVVKPGMVLGATSGSWVPAKTAATAANARCIVDIHGAAGEEIEYAYPKSNWRDADIRAAELNEGEMLKNSWVVICQSEAMVRHLRSKHPDRPGRVIAYGCGVDTDIFRFDAAARARVRAELGVTEQDSVLVYSGGLHRWQLVDRTLECFRVYLRVNPGNHKLMLLSREEPTAVLAEVRRHAIPEESVVVRQLGHADVPGYLSAGDVGFLLRHDSVVNRVASPTKLGEYLACGLPVAVGPVAGYWVPVDRAPQCTLVVDPDNPEMAALNLDAFIKGMSKHREHIRALCSEQAACHLSTSGFSKALQAALRETCGWIEAA